jgi:hypothetical protein
MKKILLFTLTFLLLGCQNSEQPTLDQTSSVLGKVRSEDGLLIDSCIVGFIGSDVDPTIVINDSIFLHYAEIFAYSSDGNFRIDWFLGSVPLPYDRMYAFKSGFILWHYDRERDLIINLEKYTDSIDIVLEK